VGAYGVQVAAGSERIRQRQIARFRELFPGYVALRDRGLREPVVTIAAVGSIDRQSSGKLKRFVPRN
jgi:hypothetical protein